MTKSNRFIVMPGIAVAFVLALSFVLVLHAAIPLLGVPTLGQAVWTIGFSQSFVNDSILSIFARNFGAPDPAAIAFGLAGAYPAGLLLSVGFRPPDAYAAMVAIWLSISFVGAWRLALTIGANNLFAIAAAVLWTTMPVIWVHSGYSMLSLGIALLPTYFLSSHLILFNPIESSSQYFRFGAGMIASCLVAVFMDGYTFVMFAVGATLMGVYAIVIGSAAARRRLTLFSIPVLVFAFILAYLAYGAYVGDPQFRIATIDHFRGWGADVTFFLAPTRGIHWLWDTLGLSIERSNRLFFGDESVWTTTFSLPVIAAGVVAWWRMKSTNKLATAYLLIGLVGLYMSLGPSLKVNSVRPDEMIQADQFPVQMARELAIGPTGSEWISTHVPGFQNMRASYRWIALAVFGFWMLFVLLMADRDRKIKKITIIGVSVLLTISNLPHPDKLHTGIVERSSFLAIDQHVQSDLREMLDPGERVVFLPFRNDFLVNFMSASLGIRAFNIGGDKNLEEARKHWPPTLRGFRQGRIDEDFARRILAVLTRCEADVVVLPYLDMLWAAHSWPAPTKYKQDILPTLEELDSSALVYVDRRVHYSFVRMVPTLACRQSRR